VACIGNLPGGGSIEAHGVFRLQIKTFLFIKNRSKNTHRGLATRAFTLCLCDWKLYNPFYVRRAYARQRVRTLGWFSAQLHF